MMYRILFLLLVLLSLGCTKERLPVRFEMAYFNQQFEIPAGIDVFETHYFPILDIPTKIDDYLFTSRTKASDISSILPRSCTFSNISSNASYNFIREVSVRIFSRDNPEDKYEIFYNNLITDRTGSELVLFPNENDMKDILLGQNFSVEVVLVRLRSTPSEFINTRMDLSFDVR